MRNKFAISRSQYLD